MSRKQPGAGSEKLLRSFLPPMLATLAERAPRDEDQYIYEMKYDGFRALAALVDGDLTVWSRNGIDLSDRFPGAAAAVEKLAVESVVLDGEVVALDDEGA